MYLRSVEHAHLHHASLVVVEDAVSGKATISVVVELDPSCQAVWILSRHQHSEREQHSQCQDGGAAK